MTHQIRLKDSNQYDAWRPVVKIDAVNALVVYTGPHDEALVAKLDDVLMRETYESKERVVALGMPLYGSVNPTPYNEQPTRDEREVIVAIVYSGGTSFYAPHGYILSSGRMVTHLYDIRPEK